MAVSNGSGWQTRLFAATEAIALVLGLFLFASLLVIAVSEAVVNAGFASADGVEIRIVTTLTQFGAFAIGVGWYVHVTGRWELLAAYVPSNRQLALVAVGTVVLLGSQFAITAALGAFGISTGTNQAIIEGREQPWYLLAMVPLSILVVGPIEELLFRGVLQGRLRDSWGPWPAIVIATIVFGVVHLPAIAGTPGQQYATVFTVALLGLLLGYLYERTGNLVVPAAVHGLNNAAIFGLQYLIAIGILGV